MQPVLHHVRPTERHWVGDGFHVSTLVSPHRLDPQLISPFLLLDHAAPRRFEPAARRRGVGEHPHRGFETVTFAYRGEVEHRDSNGGGGLIEPGDVQWMTAASGVVHEEFQSQDFTSRGGLFEMVQLWVNLPAARKMSSPRYQPLRDADFPRVPVGDVEARVIAGGFDRRERGPAQTHSDINVSDLSVGSGAEARFRFADGTTTLLLVLAGKVRAQRSVDASAGELLVLDRRQPGDIELAGVEPARLLVLNGTPLGEPVVAHGPFVMNTADEVRQAYADYRAGRMGHL